MDKIKQVIALGISYHGAAFHGWQLQSQDIPTVQACVERALSMVANERIQITCAGRTDAGVHASKQVGHFHTEVARPEKTWLMGANANLPDTVSIVWSRSVTPTFNARYSAISRRYMYVIYPNPIRSALYTEMMMREYRPLNVDAMQTAAQLLLGEHDFSSFRAANCQSNTPMRNLQKINVTRQRDIIVVDIQANAFLYHMVRNIVGVLLDIGAGEKPVAWMAELLALRDRTQASMTAPAHGLYLVDVIYPQNPEIPLGPALPHLLSGLLPD